MAVSSVGDEFEFEAHNLAQQARRLAEVLEVRARRLAERAYRYRSLADSIDDDDVADVGLEADAHRAVERLLMASRAVPTPGQRAPAGALESGAGAPKAGCASARKSASAARASGDNNGPGRRGKAPRIEVLRTLANADHALSIAEIASDVLSRLPGAEHETVRVAVYNLKRSGYVNGANARFRIADKGRSELQASATAH